jgi:hypothetical protein
MPREPKPWYRSRDDAWYVQLNRKQHFLCKGKQNKQQAKDSFYLLMAREGKAPPKDITLGELCIRFRFWSQQEHAASTAEWYRGHLQSFLDHDDRRLGTLKAVDLKPSHVASWVQARKLGQSTRRGAITAVKALLSWACKQDILDENPLKNLERPPMMRRRALTPVEIEAIFAAVPDLEFRDFLTALRLTGARPSEVASVTAADVPWGSLGLGGAQDEGQDGQAPGHLPHRGDDRVDPAADREASDGAPLPEHRR